MQAINREIIIRLHKYRLFYQFWKELQIGHRAEVGKFGSQSAFGFFSSGRNDAILRSSGIDPVNSDRLITVLNTGTGAE